MGGEVEISLKSLPCRPVSSSALVGRWRLFGFPHTNPAVRQGFPAREPLRARIGRRAVRRVCKKERRKPLENSELIKTQFGAHL